MLGNIKPDIRTGSDFEPVPSDKYTLLIVDVNLIQQKKYQSVEEEDVLNYQFAILEEKPMPVVEGKEETNTRGRFLWKRCRLALNDRSWLGKLAKAAVGRSLTKEEMESFDAESIIGEQVSAFVEQSASKKDSSIIYNNIISFEKVAKKLEPVEFEAKETGVVEKSTVPAEAPKTDEEIDNFLGKIEEEKESEAEVKEEDSVEEIELQLKLAKAKSKAVEATAKK